MDDKVYWELSGDIDRIASLEDLRACEERLVLWPTRDPDRIHFEGVLDYLRAIYEPDQGQ